MSKSELLLRFTNCRTIKPLIRIAEEIGRYVTINDARGNPFPLAIFTIENDSGAPEYANERILRFLNKIKARLTKEKVQVESTECMETSVARAYEKSLIAEFAS